MILDDAKTLLNIDLGDTSKDNLLNIFLRIVKQKIQYYLNSGETLDEIEANYPDAITLFVVESYKNKNVKSNVVSQTQDKRSTTYKNFGDIPDSVKVLLPMPYITLM